MLSFFKTISQIISIGFAVLVIGRICPVAGAEFGMVNAYKLNMRSGPDRNAPVIRTIDQGARVRILKHIDGWLEIDHEGQTGFIRNRRQYVRILPKEDGFGLQPEGNDGNRHNVLEESEKLRREIEKRKADVKAYSEKETTIIDGLDQIDRSISKARKRSSEYRSELTVLEGQINEASRTVKALLKSIETGEVYVAKRLVGIYKMTVLGKMQVLASADSIYDFLIRKAALEKILAYDAALQNSLLENKAALAELLEKLNGKKAERVSLEEKLQQQIGWMSKEREKRRRLLSEIRSRKSLELAAVDSLQQAAEALDKTIESFGRQEKSIHQPEKKPLQKPFSALKGVLTRPVNGNVVSKYGPYTDTRYNVQGFLSGIHFQAERGEPIHAVSGGTVVYAGWFKGYGNMLIIDHGGSYHTVYAHAEELFKSKGDGVEANEVVATVGDSGSMTGARLYFEIRHHGKPMDPLTWIRRG